MSENQENMQLHENELKITQIASIKNTKIDINWVGKVWNPCEKVSELILYF